MGEKKEGEKLCPEAAGEFQEGENAPVASEREPAGTMEGGDHLPRQGPARGEANHVEIPILKSRISKLSHNIPFSAENRTVLL